MFLPYLESYYWHILRKELLRKYRYSNPFDIPEIKSIHLNISAKEMAQDKKQIYPASALLELISGQKPLITKAKSSISNFKLREGSPIGAKVCLRGHLAYEFLQKLGIRVLPRIRDFQGIVIKSCKNGCISFSVKNLLLFSETEFLYDNLKKSYGMNVTIVTNARSIKEVQDLLSGLMIPVKEKRISIINGR